MPPHLMWHLRDRGVVAVVPEPADQAGHRTRRAPAADVRQLRPGRSPPKASTQELGLASRWLAQGTYGDEP
jgi:hypothetical protein